MKTLFLLVFIFFIIISIVEDAIIIPYQTYNPLLTKNETLIELIKNSPDQLLVDTLSRNLIYTELNVGQNIQTVPTFLEMRTKDLIIKDINIPSSNSNSPPFKNSNFEYRDNYLLNSIFKKKYYNSNYSDSYHFVKYCYEFFFDIVSIKNFCADESIYFMKKEDKNDTAKTKDINLLITFKKSELYDHRPAVIGLNYYSKFISELKDRKEIKEYDFSFKYSNTQEEKGELIIGDSLYLYDKDTYKENDMRTAKIIKEPSIKWSTNFDVFISNIKEAHLQIDEIFFFFIEEFFITGSNKYFNYIEENFFNKYIEQKLCRRGMHTKAFYEKNYIHMMCYIEDENKRKEFFEEFPNLKLYQKEMNFNFTLTAKDLFTIIPDGKRILFNIDFTNNSNEWILGKPFFKKYQLNFNSDSNLISYFIQPKDLENNLEIKPAERKGLKIFLIIFFTILVFIGGIIFGRVLCSKYNRKIRANELEDNYNYISKDSFKENNENDVKKFNFSNSSNFKSKYYNLN